MKIIHRCANVKKALTHLQYKAKNNKYDFVLMKNDIDNAKFHLKELTLLINRYQKELCRPTQKTRS